MGGICLNIMGITLKIEPIIIGKEQYFTVSQMAALTNKSDQTIYNLILQGNSVRKMKSFKIAGRTLVPCSELIEFPFTFAGPNAKDNVYHYNEKGETVFPKGADKK